MLDLANKRAIAVAHVACATRGWALSSCKSSCQHWSMQSVLSSTKYAANLVELRSVLGCWEQIDDDSTSNKSCKRCFRKQSARLLKVSSHCRSYATCCTYERILDTQMSTCRHAFNRKYAYRSQTCTASWLHQALALAIMITGRVQRCWIQQNVL